MTELITLKLTHDECETIVDALEADMQGYLEAAEEAAAQKAGADARTFREAAERVGQVLVKVRAVAGDEDG